MLTIYQAKMQYNQQLMRHLVIHYILLTLKVVFLILT